MTDSLYRKELPKNLIAFNSEFGKKIFKKALEDGMMEMFFPLIEQFHTQNDPCNIFIFLKKHFVASEL
jgi:glutathione gamma-glutamylcysteinyltransferase